MSRMSEQHDDLSTIHAILLGQRKVAQDLADKHEHWNDVECCRWKEQVARVQCIDDLLLEIEAAGVVWPDNVVELNTVTPPLGMYCTRCANGNRVEVCGCGDKTRLSVEHPFWPDKQVEKFLCDCGGDIHPEHGPNC